MKLLDNILFLSKALIRIRSTADNPSGLKEALDLVLLHLTDFTIERFERNGIHSALVYKGNTRPKTFRVMLNGHLDIIPGKDSQYTPKIEGDRLLGVGSMDMKANVAVLINIFKEMAQKVDFDLGLQLVTDEEVGGFHGTKYHIESGVQAEFVIAGEPTNFDIVNQTKGVLCATVTAQGTTAHSAYPWRGTNAIINMQAFLENLSKKFPTLTSETWETTVNVSSIHSKNTAFNKIPDHCECKIDIRFIPEDADTIEETIRTLLPKDCELFVEILEPAVQTNNEHSFVQALSKASESILQKKVILRGAHGSSDARHFSVVGGVGVEFGPIGGGIGSDEEWVDIPSLHTYYRALKRFLESV